MTTTPRRRVAYAEGDPIYQVRTSPIPNWLYPGLPTPSRVVEGLAYETVSTPARWTRAAPPGTPVAVTVSFPETAFSGFWQRQTGFRPLSEAEKTAARQALAAWAAVCGLSFVEVPPDVGGDIRFAAYAFHGFVAGARAYSSPPLGFHGHADEDDADIFLNTEAIAPDDSFEPGNYWFETLLHEIGHALGLEHPNEGRQKLTAEQDTSAFTVQSYNGTGSTPVQAPGPGDIEAVQYLYGADDGGVTARWDAAARAVVVTGDEAGNALYDTARADRLDGGAGHDTLYALAGADTLVGGPGDDTLIGGPDATLALFSAAQSQYRFTAEPDGTVRVDGPDGSDLLRHVRRVRFADGPAVAVSALPVRRWPEVVRPVPELTAAAGRRFRYQLADDTFLSPEGGRLTWRLRQEDGTALPGWLRFSAATRTLSGTVPAGAADLTLRVTARDAAGREAGDGFHLFITAAGGGSVRAAASPVPAARTVVRGNAGNNRLRGKARAEEFLCGAGDDDVSAGDGDDIAWGGDGDDEVDGDGGEDVIWAGEGDDYTIDGDGNDQTFGGTGNDTLHGAGGDDLVVGGTGADELWSEIDRDAPAERNTLYGGTGDTPSTLTAPAATSTAATATTCCMSAIRSPTFPRRTPGRRPRRGGPTTPRWSAGPAPTRRCCRRAAPPIPLPPAATARWRSSKPPRRRTG